MPGYGWLFPLEDGRTNVGLGTLDTTSAFQKTDYKDVMRRWVEDIFPEWQLEHDESAGPIRGAALPMGFNRTPLYADGLLLVGDSGGMVNPFNGEGIDYALEAARLGAELVAQAMARPSDAARERVLAAYPKVMKDELGGYFTLGRWFAHAIGNPEVMRLATKYGLPRTGSCRCCSRSWPTSPTRTSKGAERPPHHTPLAAGAQRMSHASVGATVTPSSIETDAPRMGAPRTCASQPPLHASHDSHDRKARDLG